MDNKDNISTVPSAGGIAPLRLHPERRHEARRGPN